MDFLNGWVRSSTSSDAFRLRDARSGVQSTDPEQCDHSSQRRSLDRPRLRRVLFQ
jgi:hypothetical protein